MGSLCLPTLKKKRKVNYNISVNWVGKPFFCSVSSLILAKAQVLSSYMEKNQPLSINGKNTFENFDTQIFTIRTLALVFQSRIRIIL